MKPTLFLCLLLFGRYAGNAQILDYSQLVSWWRLNGNTADSHGTNHATWVGQPQFDAGPQAGTGCAVLEGTGYGMTQVLDDAWHHVAMTYDGSGTAAGVRIYVDGQDDTSDATDDTLAGTILAEEAELGLGTRQNGANHNFWGSLSEVSVWNTALTPGNIVYLYQSGIPAVLPPPAIRLSEAAFTVPATFRSSWNSVVDKSYRVEASANLKDWIVAADNFPSGGASSGITTFTSQTAAQGQMFYRVVPR